jgi:PAS domain S-box-containing protein
VKSIRNDFIAIHALLLRIDPLTFVSNPRLIALLGNTNFTNIETVSNPFEAIFQTSHDSMFVLNSDQIIERVNLATTQIFGFSPEQILGQNIELFFPSSDPLNISFFKTMQLMKDGQSGLIYETDLNGKKDSEANVFVRATLLGMSSTRKNAEYFILICKDLTIESHHKHLVEEAKMKSEQILLQILPKDIIFRLNKGETDISFTVPIATMIFIDIVQFSKYMETLNASTIMNNLVKFLELMINR